VLIWDKVSKLGNKLNGDDVTHLNLDRKTYCMELNMKMFICRGYNGSGVDNVMELSMKMFICRGYNGSGVDNVMELSMKMFICRGYNGNGVDNVSAIYNGWK
jgi:uncharacterized protein YodC (DUF2158 family)